MTEFKRLRRAISEDASSSDALALAITAIDVVVYVTALIGFCTASGFLRWFDLAVASIMAGALFLIGHDASHRALAKTPWLNDLIAHVAFMPTLHPQTAWIIGHNRRHHAYTNLRGVDYVWTPWSPAEYLSASTLRRALYRFYRTPIGIGFYYPIEIWWSHMWHTDDVDRTYDGSRRVVTDKVITLAGFGVILASAFALCMNRGQAWNTATITALAAVTVPLIVYHFLMSVVIFIHHTHPSVRWFGSHETYDPLAAQMQDTIHVRFPKPVELLFHEIFQHTAHHMNPRVPLYRFARAQRTLEGANGPTIVQESFSVRYLLKLLKECQLYDYDTNRWLNIEEAVATARHTRRTRRSSDTREAVGSRSLRR